MRRREKYVHFLKLKTRGFSLADRLIEIFFFFFLLDRMIGEGRKEEGGGVEKGRIKGGSTHNPQKVSSGFREGGKLVST